MHPRDLAKKIIEAIDEGNYSHQQVIADLRAAQIQSDLIEEQIRTYNSVPTSLEITAVFWDRLSQALDRKRAIPADNFVRLRMDMIYLLEVDQKSGSDL